MNKALVMLVLFLAGALSACGGGDGRDTMSASMADSQQGNGSSQSESDQVSWFARVLAVMGTSADTAEPVVIGDGAVDRPESTEPVVPAI